MPSRNPVELLLSLVLALLAVGSSEAHACSCYARPSPEEAFHASDAVFHGLVIDSVEGDDDGGGLWVVTFQIVEAWKGISGTLVEVRTGTICGVWGEPGERGVVYARISRNDGLLWMHYCSRTRLDDGDDWADEACALRRSGFIPVEEGGAPEYACPPPSPCGVRGNGITVILLACPPCLWLSRRRRLGIAPSKDTPQIDR